MREPTVINSLRDFEPWKETCTHQVQHYYISFKSGSAGYTVSGMMILKFSVLLKYLSTGYSARYPILDWISNAVFLISGWLFSQPYTRCHAFSRQKKTSSGISGPCQHTIISRLVVIFSVLLGPAALQHPEPVPAPDARAAGGDPPPPHLHGVPRQLSLDHWRPRHRTALQVDRTIAYGTLNFFYMIISTRR